MRRWLGVGCAAVLLLGCGKKKAGEDVQALAAAIAEVRKTKPDHCPSGADLRANAMLVQQGRNVDPWGNAFTVECKSTRVSVRSSGSDGRDGTADDITATAMSNPGSEKDGAPAPAAKALSVSEVGKLGRPGQTGRTFLFSRREDYDESLTLVVARDRDGYAALVRKSAMACTPGTRVRIIDANWTGGQRVRVLDGPFAGESGWLAMEEIQRE